MTSFLCFNFPARVPACFSQKPGTSAAVTISLINTRYSRLLLQPFICLIKVDLFQDAFWLLPPSHSPPPSISIVPSYRHFIAATGSSLPRYYYALISRFSLSLTYASRQQLRPRKRSGPSTLCSAYYRHTAPPAQSLSVYLSDDRACARFDADI